MRGCSPHYHETLGLTDSVDTKLIVPPRSALRDSKVDLDELVSSVREKGLIEPIIVRPIGGTFEVVAGARRFEACKRLRWTKIPCIIRNLSDKDAYEMSLTENIQRKTMNPLEEARAFQDYVDTEGWGGESSLAKKIGKSQEYVSQRLSLLSLPRTVKERIIRRQISPSVATEIARVSDPALQLELSERAAKAHLTVSTVREAIQSIETEQTWHLAVHAARVNRSLAPPKLRSDNRIGEEFPEADFGIRIGRRDAAPRELDQLENGILILKLALARLSTLVDNLAEESDAWEMLAEKRFLIHEMIDSLIKAKIKINRRLEMTVWGVQH